MDFKEAFKVFRAKLIEELFKQEAYKAVRAFGTFESYVRSDESAEISNERYTQFGTSYTTAMDVGVPKGTVSNVNDLFEWVKLRKYGIKFTSDAQAYSIAEAIAKAHMEKGSFKRRNADARTSIIDTAIKNSTPTLYEAITKQTMIKVNSEVQNEINKINKEV